MRNYLRILQGIMIMEKLGNREMMRTITLEEHYATPAFLDGPGRKLNEQAKMAKHFGYGKLIEELSDLGDKRIAEMDAAGIDVQVLSLTAPSVQQLDATEAVELTREANDYLIEAMQLYPKRFAGFATLPTADPNIAAEELERMVNEYGFKGGNINGHTQGRYLDDKFFWPILERAEALKVPLYIHPTLPPKPVIEAYYAGRLLTRGDKRVIQGCMGLAYRDSDPCSPPHCQWSFGPVSGPSDRDWPHGRSSPIYDAQNRQRFISKRNEA